MLANSVLQALRRSTHVPTVTVAHVFIYDVTMLNCEKNVNKKKNIVMNKIEEQMWTQARVANRPLLERTVLYLTLSVLVLYEVQKCPLF